MQISKEMGIEAYYRLVDLRANVLDGTATEEEREAYFAMLRTIVLEFGVAMAQVGMQYNVPVAEPGHGQDMAVLFEGLLAVAMGVPGPTTQGLFASTDDGTAS